MTLLFLPTQKISTLDRVADVPLLLIAIAVGVICVAAVLWCLAFVAIVVTSPEMDWEGEHEDLHPTIPDWSDLR